MKYYLVPIEEDDLDIISENWCIGETSFKSFYTRGAWNRFNELIIKSSPENNLLNYYEIKNDQGNKVDWTDFLDILENQFLKIDKGWN